MSDSWYEVVDGSSDLSQGDVLLELDVPKPSEDGPQDNDWPSEITRTNAVVVSNACDLANRKVERVVLCPIFQIDRAQRAIAKTGASLKEALKGIRSQKHHRYCMLHPLGDDAGALPWIVDLGETLSLSLGYVTRHCSRFEKRWRLSSPYREWLSQRYAWLYIRIGHPVELPDLDSFGPEVFSEKK